MTSTDRLPVPGTQATGTGRYQRCGTNAGYQKHQYEHEDACQPCKDAHNFYTRRDSTRAYQRARQRALAQLAARHAGEYAALLAAERAKEEAA